MSSLLPDSPALEYVSVAAITDVSEERPLVVIHCAYRIAIYQVGECYYAIEDICPHMGAFLSNGYREGQLAVCPWHNWQFDLATGETVTPETTGCVQTFPLKVENGLLWLPQQPAQDIESEDNWDW